MHRLIVTWCLAAAIFLALLHTATPALASRSDRRRGAGSASRSLNPAPEQVDNQRRPIRRPKTLNDKSHTNSASLSIVIEAPQEELIRCKVCNRAIEHIWDKGAELRAHCKIEGTDPRCDFSNMHSFGIEEMASAVCEGLPETHQALQGSEFDIVLAEFPEHPRSVAKVISRACRRWLHEQHGAEKIALYIYSNLDAGKAKGQILHALQHRFCKNACNPGYKLPGDAHDAQHYDEL